MWATATMAHSPVASDNAYPTVSGLDLKYLSISALIVSGAVIGAEDHWLFDLVNFEDFRHFSIGQAVRPQGISSHGGRGVHGDREDADWAWVPQMEL